MPVVLDDGMLIPPSMRRKHYSTTDRIVEVTHAPSVSSGTIELGSHRSISPPRSPVIIHQDHYIPIETHGHGYGHAIPASEVEREYVIEGSSAGGSRKYYRGAVGGRNMEVVYASGRGRARSVGAYDSDSCSCCSSCDEGSVVYVEDGGSMGSQGGYSLRRSERKAQRGRHVVEGGLLAADVVRRRGRSHHGSPVRHHHHGEHGRRHHGETVRRVAASGIGLHEAREAAYSSRSEGQHPHRARHIAEAGLAGVATGAAIEKLRHRPSDSVSSAEGSGNHRVRHLAEAGIATAGAKMLYDHRREQQHQQQWHEQDHDPHRRARHLAEAGLGIAAAGAAKELYDHHRRQRRSPSASSSGSSRSRSRSRMGHHTGRHVAAAALGATTAGLAAQKHVQHRRQRSRSFSSDSSDSEDHHRGRKVAAGVAGVTAAGLAGKYLYDRNRRSSSTSSTSSSNSGKSHHKLRNAAMGAAGVGLAKHHYDRHRSPSKPGILRRKSKSVEPPRHRSSSRGAALAKAAVSSMAGAMASDHHRDRRARSASGTEDREDRRRRRRERREKKVHYHGDQREYERSDSERHRRRRESRGVGDMVGGALRSAVAGGTGPRRDGGGGGIRQGLAHEVAYRVGEGVAESLQRRRAQ